MKSKSKKTRSKGAQNAPFVFFSTFPDEESALKFARMAVDEQWAACVNILGAVRSIYFWDDKINDDNEVMVIGKTTTKAFKKLKEAIKSWHTYEAPELISFKIDDGHSDYLKWISKTLE